MGEEGRRLRGRGGATQAQRRGWDGDGARGGSRRVAVAADRSNGSVRRARRRRRKIDERAHMHTRGRQQACVCVDGGNGRTPRDASCGFPPRLACLLPRCFWHAHVRFRVRPCPLPWSPPPPPAILPPLRRLTVPLQPGRPPSVLNGAAAIGSQARGRRSETCRERQGGPIARRARLPVPKGE